MITTKMRQAGELFSSFAYDLSVHQALSDEPIDWTSYPKNVDILKSYLKGDISVVEGIYTAMERAKNE